MIRFDPYVSYITRIIYFDTVNQTLRIILILDNISSDFGLPPDTDNDFHVKEIQDMISVIQRMIKDGKKKIVIVEWTESF